MSRVDRGVFLVPSEGRYIMISRGQFVGWTNAASPKLRMDTLRGVEKRLGWYEPRGNQAARDTLRELTEYVGARIKAREEMRRRDNG